MTPTIRVDEDVYERLKDEAEPFIDTPNTVLRRLLELPSQNGTGVETDSEESFGATQADTPPAGKRSSGQSAKARSPRRAKKRGRQRAVRGSLVPQEAYELPILQVLAEKDGRAPSREVIDAIEPLLKEKLTEIDRSKTSSGEIRWRNRAQFVRLTLIEKGEMVKNSPRGVWEITESGKQRAAQA
jgi:hypothetical protein